MLLWALLWTACAPREVAPYLRPTTPTEQATPPAPVSDLPSAIRAIIGRDPLARRPDPSALPPGADLPGLAPLRSWAVATRRLGGCDEATLEQEAAWRGTAAVALSRGAALGCLEARLLIDAAPHPVSGHELFVWIGPFRRDERPLPPDAREVLAWMGPLDLREAGRMLLRIAERRVLLGWLDGPEIPLGPVSDLLVPPLYDRLLAEPEGALIDARAHRRQDAERGAEGLRALEQATTLALLEVAADRDAEQAAWKERRAAARAELQLSEDQSPISVLLERARVALNADAAVDASAGLSLVASSAARLHGPCPPGECRDFDRTATLGRAATFAPEVAPLAACWQVYALKASTDAVEVSLSRPTFGPLIPDLLDALSGTGEAHFPALLLRRSLSAPQLFLDLTRGAGGPDQLDAPGLLDNLRARLARVTDAALALEQPPEREQTLRRIRARSGP